MRIIKYRIWDSKIKQYATEDYQFLISRTGDLWGSVGDWLGVHFSEDAGFQIEQYTGINDVKGKPVYEGDIVQNMNHSDIWGVVEYHETGFLIKSCGNTFGKYFPLTKSCNVLGNIHENPELLEAD